ncbi:MAG TPA: alpha/beta fold hydrolase [Nitrospira sp.]
MEQDLSFFDPQGHRVAAVLTTPAGETDRIAILCHGFLSGKRSTTNKTLTRLLNAQGIATFAFDFFGQGDSEGPFETLTTTTAVVQANAALDLVRQKGFRKLGLMGSSFGGLVAILTAAQRHDLACLALKCPVVDFAEELRLTLGDAEMAAWQSTDTILNIMGGAERIRLRYTFYEDCLRRIAYGPAKEITAPTLIVQGDQDECVPLHQSQQLAAALTSPNRMELLPGADHQFTKSADFNRMTTLIAEWFTTYLT